jgi:uncharacterized membrane protein YwaF
VSNICIVLNILVNLSCLCSVRHFHSPFRFAYLQNFGFWSEFFSQLWPDISQLKFSIEKSQIKLPIVLNILVNLSFLCSVRNFHSPFRFAYLQNFGFWSEFFSQLWPDISQLKFSIEKSQIKLPRKNPENLK